jgi:hypothetical protein
MQDKRRFAGVLHICLHRIPGCAEHHRFV